MVEVRSTGLCLRTGLANAQFHSHIEIQNDKTKIIITEWLFPVNWKYRKNVEMAISSSLEIAKKR